MDEPSGTLELISKTTGVANPSYLAFDSTQRFMYAVNELKKFEGKPTGTISSFAVDPETGKLEFLNKQLTHGTDPLHVIVDKRDEYVFVANYMSGSVCVLPVLKDHTLAKASDFIQHEGAGINPVRQTGAHPHSVWLDKANRFLLVPDLGLDKLIVYRFDRDRGMLEPNRVPWIKTTPGAGPRHMAFHPNGKFAYLINELDSTMVALSYNGRAGTLKVLEVISTLPDDFEGSSTCSHVEVSPSGAFLYGSNRGHDSIVIYKIDQRTGRLALVGYETSQGRTPRNFAVDPMGEFFLVANQDSDSIVPFRIDQKTGRLKATGQIVKVGTPVCVRFYTQKSRFKH
jgi:6-phosphogluconolactonase